jgi:hypothetical protein
MAAGAPWGPAAAGAPGDRTPLRQQEGGREPAYLRSFCLVLIGADWGIRVSGMG